MSSPANAHDLRTLSSKLSFPSTSNGRYAERDLVGAKMSSPANTHDLRNLSSKLSFPSTSSSRYAERDLVGAKMSSPANAHDLRNFSFPSTSNGRYAERDLVGAWMSRRNRLDHEYSTSTSHPFLSIAAQLMPTIHPHLKATSIRKRWETSWFFTLISSNGWCWDCEVVEIVKVHSINNPYLLGHVN